MLSVATEIIPSLINVIISKFLFADWQLYMPDTATIPSIQYVPGTRHLVRNNLVPGTPDKDVYQVAF